MPTKSTKKPSQSRSSKSKKAPLLRAGQPIRWYTLTGIIAGLILVGVIIKLTLFAAASYPTTPPAAICGNSSQLSGPTSAPSGAVTVPAGNNSGVSFNTAGATYWFAPGTHTLGTGQFSQIQPANNSTFVGAPGAIIDGQGKNSYAMVGTATGVTVKYLTFQNFGIGSSPTTPSSDDSDQGVVNHDAGHNWTITNNTVQYSAGAGVFVGTGDKVSYNCLTQNGQYGFSAYEPNDVSNITLDHNEISFNDTYNWEAKKSGCGCTGGGKFWRTHGASITDNYVHDNHSVGMWADTDNNGFDFENNYISNNASEGIIYETSYNFLVKNNTFINNAWSSGKADTGFPHSALYISESGSDSRVGGNYGAESDITGNLFQNNWGGVILWENSDRYCSSAANTSGGDCTLGNPSVANLSTCGNSSLLKTTPYINDCRWRTQNVKVTSNTFQMSPSTVGSSCSASNDCGFNGIFSQYGSFAPYTGWVVAPHISNTQNNTFSNNTYTGTWNFMGFDQNERVSFAQWQAGFNDSDGSGMHFNAQDSGSTMNSTATSTPLPTPTPTKTPTPTSTPTPTPTTTSTPTPTSTSVTCPAPSTDNGTDTLTLSVPSAGTYTLWLRLLQPAAAANTVHAQVDTSACFEAGNNSATSGAWTWVNSQNGTAGTVNKLSLTSGNHTIKLIGIQAGVEVDRILLVSDTCMPTGTGDNCANATPTPTPTTPTPTPTPTRTPIPTSTPTPVVTPTPTPTTSPVTGSGDGLTGNYFNNMALSGQPVLTRIDRTINFDWWWSRLSWITWWWRPAPQVNVTKWSARWNGQVLAPTSGTYTFTTTSDDGMRLWVNGQLLVDNWTDHAATKNSGTIALQAGQKYHVVLEYYQDKGAAVAKLSWTKPNDSKSSVVPQSDLYSQ